ncbi:hypothetical protein [Streptomyces sp. MK37H]|uniref:LysM peptidoglycan-binding domain-containing protein n=1 Tax=Streptomyces sp. MK37H TaxID=2699117 RepID=UPI001B38A2E9|nr:hypothetical protein [Streptomyces sp. MK37H]
MSKLALRYLGAASRWPEIYEANRAVIEAAARKQPGPPVNGTSDHGHWIFPGTVLTIPGSMCTSAAHSQIAPELPKVQLTEAAELCGHAIFDAVGEETFGYLLKRSGLVSKKVLRVVDIGVGAVMLETQAGRRACGHRLNDHRLRGGGGSVVDTCRRRPRPSSQEDGRMQP